MDFDVSVSGVGEREVDIVDSSFVNSLKANEQRALATMVNAAGVLSQQAQGLSAPITDLNKIKIHGHKLYVAARRTSTQSTTLYGILKVGTKKLFIQTSRGTYEEIEPRCVLDFYVHESCQRQGVGRKLFEAMLAEESLRPHLLAYDCPSPKFLSFLRKHYGLASFIPQANNFVVFDSYFQPAGVPQAAPDQRLGRRASRQVDLDHRHPALARYELARELTHGAAGPRRSNVAHRTGDTIGEKARATLHAGADKHGDIGATREASPEPHAPAKVSGAFDGARTARWGGQDGDASTSRGPAPLPDSRAVEGRRPPLTGWEPRLGATGADAPGGRARRGTCDVGVSAATWGLGRTGGGHAGGGTTGRSGGGSAYRVRPPWGVWDDETVGAGEARGTMGGSGMGMVRGPDVGQWLHPGRLAAGGWTANGGRAGGRGAVGGVGA